MTFDEYFDKHCQGLNGYARQIMQMSWNAALKFATIDPGQMPGSDTSNRNSGRRPLTNKRYGSDAG